MLILASSFSLARVSSQLQLLTQAAFTLNRGLVEPKAKWTLPEPLKCSYFSIPWGKCWHGFPCPKWAGTAFPRSAAESSSSRKKQEMHLLPISVAAIKRNRKLLPTYLGPRQPILLCHPARGPCRAGTATAERGSGSGGTRPSCLIGHVTRGGWIPCDISRASGQRELLWKGIWSTEAELLLP